MLHEQLRNAWHARKRVVPISPVLNLTPEGLVLGAGTVLVPADGPRRLKSLRGQEARVLALLSAAYGRAIAPSVLGNIERSAKAWSEGDDCLAYIHLAHAGLREPQDPYEAARRLFIVDGFMKAGTSPRAVFDALGLGATYIDAVEKTYNPAEPRVPAGSGSKSGQWTRELSFLAALPPAAVESLGGFAARLLVTGAGATAAFGLLFIPSPNNLRVEGEVSGVPGLRYSWSRDETQLRLTYDDSEGAHRTFAAYLDDDVFRDEHGRVIGRVLAGSNIAIDVAAVSPDLAKTDEAKLCPAPVPDRPGSDRGKPYDDDRARQYENYVKQFINPPPTGSTPSGFVYALPNPEQNGAVVTYDDCQKTSGILFEIKGEEYAALLQIPQAEDSIRKQFSDQALRQVQASSGRPLVWIFAEPEAADFARELFNSNKDLERIFVVPMPWLKRESR